MEKHAAHDDVMKELDNMVSEYTVLKLLQLMNIK